MSNFNKLVKEAIEKVAAEGGNQHPVEKALEYIRSTPLDMLPHSTKTNADGSATVTIEVPSLADQQKKKAEEEAMRIQQQMQQRPGAGNAAPMPAQKPTAPMRDQGAEGMGAAAGNKIEIKVAMDEGARTLKGKFPDSFLKAMGL